MAEKTSDCRLYLITPPYFEVNVFERALAAALEGGDVACVQLRLQDADDDTIIQAAQRLCPLTQSHGAAFLINDRPDLAVETGADGVHIGQNDMDYARTRAIVGPDRIVGVTCHNSRHLAMMAGEQGADYVAFGAFFPSPTKQAAHSADPEILNWWSALFEIPVVAIGGITVDNCSGLIQAGADFLAVSSGVWNHAAGPGEAVALFSQYMKKAPGNVQPD